jgi:hypothetical protein
MNLPTIPPAPPPTPTRPAIAVLPYASGRSRRRGPRVGYAVAVGVVAGLALVAVFKQHVASQASTPSRSTELVTAVMCFRSQVALFKLQHDGRLPGVRPLVARGGPSGADFAAFWAQMTQFTDPDGYTSPTKTERFCLGPYLQLVPSNRLNGSNSIASKPARGVGFVYDFAGGAGSGKVWGVDESGALVMQ